jgi:hypothetical protein
MDTMARNMVVLFVVLDAGQQWQVFMVGGGRTVSVESSESEEYRLHDFACYWGSHGVHRRLDFEP